MHSVPLLCPEVCRPRGWVGRYLLTGYTTYIPTIPTPPIPAPLFQEPLFAARVIYDLLFFFMVIIIVLNLIFGVIIDTFADLRSEKQKKEEILKTTCFICGEWCTWLLLGGWDGVLWPSVGGASSPVSLSLPLCGPPALFSWEISGVLRVSPALAGWL